jgi:hypothetical protein
MTTKKRNTKLSAREAVAGDRDLMKALMKEALQEVLEGEMTEFLGAAPSERTEGRPSRLYGGNEAVCRQTPPARLCRLGVQAVSKPLLKYAVRVIGAEGGREAFC